MRRPAALVIVLTLVAVARAAAQQNAPAGAGALTLDAALARAMEANPAIVAARLRRAPGEAAIAVAGQRPNPEVTYEAERETPRQAIGVSVPIELGGKRARRLDVARAGLDAAAAEIDALVAGVRSDMRRAYFELAAASGRLTLAEDARSLAARARDAADARFAAGDVPRLEAVQTALALLDAENDVAAAGGDVAGARAELNALLGQPLATAVTAADAMTLREVPAAADAVARASTANAELVALDRRILEQTARR